MTDLAHTLRDLGLRARVDASEHPAGSTLLVSTLDPGLKDRTRVRLTELEARALIKAWDPKRPDELLVLFAQTHREDTQPADQAEAPPRGRAKANG